MQIQTIIPELLRAVRGRHRHEEINRLFGHTYNKSGRWEKGSVRIQWKEFVRLCEYGGVPLRASLRNILLYEGEPENAAGLIRHLALQLKQEELAALLKEDRSTVSRWYSGKTSPDLISILEIIDRRTGLVPEWLGSLVEVKDLPAVRELVSRKKRQVALFFRNPLKSCLAHAFDLREYRQLEGHQEGVIAGLTGIPVREERRLIRDLERATLIRWNGLKYVTDILSAEVRDSVEDYFVHRLHWHRFTGTLLQRFRNRSRKPEFSRLGTVTFSVSDSNFRKLQRRFVELLYELLRMSEAACGSGDRLVHVNLQLIDLKEALTAMNARLPVR